MPATTAAAKITNAAATNATAVTVSVSTRLGVPFLLESLLRSPWVVEFVAATCVNPTIEFAVRVQLFDAVKSAVDRLVAERAQRSFRAEPGTSEYDVG